MSAMKKGVLYGAGGVTLLSALLFGALFVFGFGAGPDEGGYTIEAGEKRLMLEAVAYGGTMYVPIDAVSFLQGREAVVDEESGKISFGAGKPVEGETSPPAQSSPPGREQAPSASDSEAAILEQAIAFNEKNRGDILLECDGGVIYAAGDDNWFWTLYVSSASGKNIDVDRIDSYVYDSSHNRYFNPDCSYDKGKLSGLWNGSSAIEKGEKKSLSRGSGPASNSSLAYLDYYAYGKDEDGREVRGSLRIVFSKKNAGAGMAASEYDMATLRHNASFRVQVAEGVNWVPANALGKTGMTAGEIEALGNDPEKLKESIDTLYEAIQYLQVAGFKDARDNIRIEEGGLSWEHHKPGLLAITTNEGCCATNSNLLNYLLEGDYEEVGFAAYSQSDGSGHVFNYIKHNGLYYFIDLTHYRNDFLSTAIEDGSMGRYRSTDYIAGNIHEAVSVEDYVKYCTDNFNDPPKLFSIYMAANVLPIGSSFEGESVELVFPESAEGFVKTILDHPDDNIRYSFTESPEKYPEEWEPYNTKWD